MTPTEDSADEIVDTIPITPENQQTAAQTTNPGDPTTSTSQASADELNLLAKTQYARSARAINALRDLGIDRMEFSQDLGIEPLKCSLPKIALVGNQSSGKSSLIEAISQIKLPQDVGTCTRCPMEVRLSEGGEEPWSCTITLRFHAKVENEKTRNEFFAKTGSRDEVESILRRAQLAILNPSLPVQQFVHLDARNYRVANERAFSTDMIVVDIVRAPVSVTFIDLPGITNPDNDSDVRDCCSIMLNHQA